MSADIARLTGSDRLYFYDSISPIVDAATIDLSIAFRASRYGKSLDGTDDYLNCPLDHDQYERFVDALLAAEPLSRTSRTTRRSLRIACPSRRSRAAAATRYASGR